MSEGRTIFSEKAQVVNMHCIFQYKDHLGNVRLSYSDADLNGAIDPNTEIIEESNYYPFGLKQKGYNKNISPNGNALAQQWKYNGTELNEDLSLYLYEMPLRRFDPAIARWLAIDPVTHHSQSTYNGFGNNPIFWADPSGAAVVYGKNLGRFLGFNNLSQMAYDSMTMGGGKGVNFIGDAGGWKSLGGGYYINGATGEITDDWQGAVGTTLSTQGGNSATIHRFDNEGEAYKFMFQAGHRNNKETSAWITEKSVWVLPWANNTDQKSFNTIEGELGLKTFGKGLFLQFLEDGKVINEERALAQAHLHLTNSEATGELDASFAKEYRVPIFIIGPSSIGLIYDFRVIVPKTKGLSLRVQNSNWKNIHPAAIFSNKFSLRDAAIKILKKYRRL